MDPPNDQYPTTVILDNNKAPPLEVGHYKKDGGIWNLKHDNRSPKFYGVLIKT